MVALLIHFFELNGTNYTAHTQQSPSHNCILTPASFKLLLIFLTRLNHEFIFIFSISLFVSEKQTKGTIMNHEAAHHDYNTWKPPSYHVVPSLGLAIKTKFHPFPGFFSSSFFKNQISHPPSSSFPLWFTIIEAVFASSFMSASSLHSQECDGGENKHLWSSYYGMNKQLFEYIKDIELHFPLDDRKELIHIERINKDIDTRHQQQPVEFLVVMWISASLLGSLFKNDACKRKTLSLVFSFSVNSEISAAELTQLSCFSPAKALCGLTDLSPLFV